MLDGLRRTAMLSGSIFIIICAVSALGHLGEQANGASMPFGGVGALGHGWVDGRARASGCHALLGRAACLVFDTETGGFVNPSVIDLGWILADADGEPLVSYERLWKLPAGERIDRRALKAHGITASRLEREGVLAKPEVGEFLALVAAALARRRCHLWSRNIGLPRLGMQR